MPRKASTVNEYKIRICRAMDFISENLENEPTIEEIADAASFSLYHFHRIFKAAVGETIGEFTRRLRLERAAGYLYSHPDADITGIAYRYNFSSSQNFAKAFRKQFGMSPTEFRNSKTGNKESTNENAFLLHSEYTPSTLTLQLSEERKKEMNVTIEEMPECKIAYVRKIGQYSEKTCRAAFDELSNFAGPLGLFKTGSIFSIYWDDPEVTPPAKCRTDACVTLLPDQDITASSGLSLGTIAGGRYAICNFELDSSGFTAAWEDSMRWVMESNYECTDQPCLERYHNDPKDHPENKFIVDICIPLK